MFQLHKSGFKTKRHLTFIMYSIQFWCITNFKPNFCAIYDVIPFEIFEKAFIISCVFYRFPQGMIMTKFHTFAYTQRKYMHKYVTAVGLVQYD